MISHQESAEWLNYLATRDYIIVASLLLITVALLRLLRSTIIYCSYISLVAHHHCVMHDYCNNIVLRYLR